MEITLTTPAILFPAVSLLLLAYTNRFMALASIVRSLVNQYGTDENPNIRSQIKNLDVRIQLIKWMQAAGILSLISCVVAMIALYLEFTIAGEYIFIFSIILMGISLLISLWEILLSGQALRLELERCNKN